MSIICLLSVSFNWFWFTWLGVGGWRNTTLHNTGNGKKHSLSAIGQWIEIYYFQRAESMSSIIWTPYLFFLRNFFPKLLTYAFGFNYIPSVVPKRKFVIYRLYFILLELLHLLCQLPFQPLIRNIMSRAIAKAYL